MPSASESYDVPVLLAEQSLYDALCHLLNGDVHVLAVRLADALHYLSADTLIQALRQGLPGDTPLHRLALSAEPPAGGRQIPSAEGLINALPLLLWVKDRNGQFLLVNRSFAQVCGENSPAGLLGKSADDLLPPEQAAVVRETDQRVLQTGQAHQRLALIQTGQGQALWFDIYKAPWRSRDGKILGTLGFACDGASQHHLQEQAEYQAHTLDHVLAAVGEGVWEWHPAAGAEEPGMIQHSARWYALLGLPPQEGLHPLAHFLAQVHEADRGRVLAALDTCRAGLGAYVCEYRLRHAQGHYLWVRDQGRIIDTASAPGGLRLMGSVTDITALKESQHRLEHLAYHDALTQLPNRSLLADRMHMAIAQAERNGTLAAIAYLDLDDFKPINDTLGHDMGDRLLIEIARRLNASTRAGDTVARLGGDEFALIYNGLERGEDCEPTLTRLLESIASPILLQGHELHVTASIGVALCPLDGNTPASLLRHADQAMYLAKQAGRNNFRLYDPERQHRMRTQRDAQARVLAALSRGQLELHYQPTLNTLNGQTVGMEALLRWHHPERGLLRPAHFLPALRHTRSAMELGDWVLAHAIAQLEQWQEEGLPLLPLSINIASQHLLHPDFLGRLRLHLSAHTRLDPGLIQLDIQEASTPSEVKRLGRVMENCQALGVSFAMDDFGSGYASMTHLQHLPVQRVKIDQGRVRNMLEAPEDLAIVRCAIGVAQGFGREVVAEGVETEAHCHALQAMGCHLLQGDAIAQPMAAAGFRDWLVHHN